MFRLTRTETETLNRSQIATGSQKHRDPRSPLFGFTQIKRLNRLPKAQQSVGTQMLDGVLSQASR